MDHLAELARTRDATQPYFDVDYAVQMRSYAPGKWTMRQLLIHLLDCETVYFDRMRRVVADEQPLLWNFDENRWAGKLFYSERSLIAASRLFAATRDAVIELARLAPPEAHAREGVHSQAGRRSFDTLLLLTHRHNAHHLEQLAAIAAGKPWQSAPSSTQATQATQS